MSKTNSVKLPLLAAMVTLAACNSGSSSKKGDADSTGNASQTAENAIKVPAFNMADLDTTFKACDDFDNFANGNWKKQHPIPSTESRWGAFNVLDKENKEVRLKSIIAEITAKTDLKKGTEEQQIADYYRSFLDSATIEKRGITPLQPYLDKINAAANLNDWSSVCGELQKLGISTFTGFYAEADARNSKVNVLYQGQDGLSMGDKTYYERQDPATKNVRDEFVTHVDKMFQLAGLKDEHPGKTILEFETKLAKVQLPKDALRDPVKTYNRSAFSELKKLAPDFDWEGFSAKQDIKTDTLIIQNKAYLTSANALLKATPLEILKTYTRLQLLSHFASYLPKAIDDENFHFYGTVMSGRKAQKARTERAIRSADGTLGMPLGKLFAKKYFPESSKKKVSEMIENVRTVYGERVDKLTWMGDSTKQMAHKKLASFTYKIGYPDKWKDYSTINIDKGTLIENLISAALYAHKENIDKIGKPVDKTEWGMTPQTVNAYYNPLNNEVVFPAGILQPPFYNQDADDAINYGGIIAVIGHEFTHGFDDQGSQFDADGNLKNWWTKSDREKFDQLTKRYIDYFNHLEPLTGFFINGKLTVGENVADLGGLTLAYHALAKSLQGKPEPKPIDGYTWQQRFFLGWAQVWHENITDAALRNQIQTNEHSPARFRILGPLPHLAEFQAAWGCAPGSKMALPEAKRVVIW
ncbi:M13 family metallopeptidase [Chitinophaga sp. 212800010-3]|uniref:M13 family metallopeptidase n=1 Tax=unclassified Chitinophaga TaxID=2619133 RepID=UPI002DF48F2A|nr:hypothetical protein [Chitinophaga sp. 212800010-3]